MRKRDRELERALRVDARNLLKSKGFCDLQWETIWERPLLRYLTMSDKGGNRIKVVLVLRTARPDGRYPVGFQMDLLFQVNYVLVCLDEPFFYLLPLDFFKKLRCSVGRPSTNSGDQWVCNIRATSHDLETQGLAYWEDISRFAEQRPSLTND